MRNRSSGNGCSLPREVPNSRDMPHQLVHFQKTPEVRLLSVDDRANLAEQESLSRGRPRVVIYGAFFLKRYRKAEPRSIVHRRRARVSPCLVSVRDALEFVFRGCTEEPLRPHVWRLAIVLQSLAVAIRLPGNCKLKIFPQGNLRNAEAGRIRLRKLSAQRSEFPDAYTKGELDELKSIRHPSTPWARGPFCSHP